MRLRSTGTTVTTLIHSSGTSYFNGGSVAIGKTSASYTLDVTGTIRSTTSVTAQSNRITDSANADKVEIVYDETAQALNFNFI